MQFPNLLYKKMRRNVKLMKKLTAIFTIALLVFGINSQAFASTYSYSNNSFSKAWQKTGSGSNWSMTYGFNKSAINEDYAHGIHSSTSHTTIIKNANGQYSKSASKGKYANVDVRHAGNSVTYKMSY